jgi:hypothetical protein
MLPHCFKFSSVLKLSTKKVAYADEASRERNRRIAKEVASASMAHHISTTTTYRQRPEKAARGKRATAARGAAAAKAALASRD